jgi:hypothetical protein
VVRTAKSKAHKKNIVCLESLWDHDMENRLTVLPVLELTSKISGTKSILLTCNTVEEFSHNLKMLKRKSGYGILYFAFHGFPGGFLIDGSPVELEAVAELMGKGFSKWVVYFGSCETTKTRRWRISDFMARTGVSMVLGYKRWVDWVESAALDLMLLNRMQDYKDMRKFWGFFQRRYGPLIQITGLEAFHGKSLNRAPHTIRGNSRGMNQMPERRRP